MVALRPEREHEHDGSVLREAQQLLEQQDGGRVCPVQVLDRDHERRLLRQSCEETADDLERPPLQRFRRQLRNACGCVVLERQPEQRPEIRVRLVGVAHEQLLEPPAQADTHAQLRLVGPGADPVAPKKIAKRPVRKRLAVRDASALEPAGAVRLRVLAQLEQHARLADAGVAGDDQHAAAPGAERIERLAAGFELTLAADQPRFDAGDAALAARTEPRARNGPGADRPVLSLQLELPRLSPVEERLDRCSGRVVDEHRPRLGFGLEARGEVDGIAERRVLDALPCADLADDDGAGRGTDPDTEALDAPTADDLAAVLLQLGNDPQSRAQGALGVVLVRRGRAEEGEHAVPRQILDVAAERLHLPDDARDRLADDELHVLGIEALSERGRADDVREERRQHPALLANRRGAHRRAACAASARSTASSPAADRAAASSGPGSPRRRSAERAPSSAGPVPSSAALAAQSGPSPTASSARSWLQSDISSDRSATAWVSPNEAMRTRPWAYR